MTRTRIISILTNFLYYLEHLPPTQDGISSAVLVPLIDYVNGLTILLTKRTRDLETHRGQICFPGGRAESSDFNLPATALREAHEEVNLLYRAMTLVSHLRRYKTLTGFLVMPVVCLTSPVSVSLHLSDEVDIVFELPFSTLFDPIYYQCFILSKEPTMHMTYSITYHGQYIWGATAAVLASLCLIL